MKRLLPLFLLLLSPFSVASVDVSSGNITGDFGVGNELGYPIMIAGWAKYADHPAAVRYVANLGNTSGSILDSHVFRLQTTDGRFEGASITSSGGVRPATYTLPDPASLDGEWFAFIVVVRGDSDRQLYIDARANTATNDVTGAVTESLRYMVFGQSGSVSGQFFSGLLAELAIGEIDPTDQQIDDFMSGTPANSVWSNLAGYWPLDVDDSTPDDESGNGGPTLSSSGTFDADHPTITSSGGEYDTAPTVTAQTTTAYTVTGSLDAAGDVDGVACLKDQTAPTISQVQAGDCTGDVDAEATDSDSPTTGDFDFSLTLTPPDEFPAYDIYVTDGTTLTTLADEELDPPANCGIDSDDQCQFIDITSIGTGSPCEDFNTAADPDIASPDILTAPTVVDPGQYSLTIGADCHFSYDDSGAGTQQTAWNITIYDVSAEDFHAEDIDFLANNTGPDCTDIGDPAVYKADEAANTFDLDNACNDPDGEQLTYSLEYNGTHTGADNAATLTDSNADFVVDNLIGLTIDNDTDGSSCTITDNTATTVTCTLAGGSENDWDTNDVYTITYELPSGLVLNTANGEITGTPDTEDEAGTWVKITSIDIGLEIAVVEVQFFVIDTWTMPDITGGTVSAALTAIGTAAPWIVDLSLDTSSGCSDTVAADDIISQDPEAGEVDDPEPEFTAVVSTGACPVFDLTGLPLSGDWEPWIDVLITPEFISIKQQECDGDGVWASWRAGTSTTPRGSSNCRVDESLIRQEANGSAVWARWAPGVNNKRSANLQIDVRAALNADFVPN